MKEFFRRNPRIGGLLTGILTAVMSKFFIIDVITAARAHSNDIQLHMKGVVISVALFMISIIMMMFGRAGSQLLSPAPGTKKLPPLGWVLVLIVVGLSFGFYFWFKSYIESFGYKFDGI